MKKLLLLLLTLVVYNCLAQNQTLRNFVMNWQYTDQAGVPLNAAEFCSGETIYIKNKSTSTFNNFSENSTWWSIGADLTTGQYSFNFESPYATWIQSVPAGDWAYDEVIAVTLPTGAVALEFFVRHTGGSQVHSISSWTYGSSRESSKNIIIHHETVNAGPDIDICYNNGISLNGSGESITGSGSTPATGLTWNSSGGSSTPYNPTLDIWFMNSDTYTLTNSQTYQTANGPITCTATDDKVITVIVGPQTTSQIHYLCNGAAYPNLYGPPGAASYEWQYTPSGSTNSTVISTSQNVMNTNVFNPFGQYLLLATGNNGCISSSTHLIELSSSAGSNIDASFNQNVTDNGSTSSISTSSSVSGLHEWILYEVDGAGNVISLIETIQTISENHTFQPVPENVFYKVVHRLSQSPCNQWNEEFSILYQSGFIIYPNPVLANEQFAIEFGENTVDGSLVITNVHTGRVVFRQEIEGARIIKTELPSSIYSVQRIVNRRVVESETLIIR